jgi:hypothetical protein
VPKVFGSFSGASRVCSVSGSQFRKAGSELAAGTQESAWCSDALDGKWSVEMSEVYATINSNCTKSSDSSLRNHSVSSPAPFAISLRSIGSLLPIGGISRNFGPAHTVGGGAFGDGLTSSRFQGAHETRSLQSARAGFEFLSHRRTLKALRCTDTRLAMEWLAGKAMIVDMQAPFSPSRRIKYCAAPVAADEV